jgi:HK97 family phage prohead protease
VTTIYDLQLLPIGSWRDKAQNGQAVSERFDRYCLTGDAAYPKFIPVLWHHDFDRKDGNVVELKPEGGWWVASITIDQTKPLADYARFALQHGTLGCSAGWLPIHSRTAADGRLVEHTLIRLAEVSLTQTPAFHDARLIRTRQVADLARPRTNPVRHTPSASATATPRKNLIRRDLGEILRVR